MKTLIKNKPSCYLLPNIFSDNHLTYPRWNKIHLFSYPSKALVYTFFPNILCLPHWTMRFHRLIDWLIDNKIPESQNYFHLLKTLLHSKYPQIIQLSHIERFTCKTESKELTSLLTFLVLALKNHAWELLDKSFMSWLQHSKCW